MSDVMWLRFPTVSVGLKCQIIVLHMLTDIEDRYYILVIYINITRVGSINGGSAFDWH